VGGFVVEGTQVLAARSSVRVALASAAGRLCLAWTGTDGRLNLLSSLDGECFGDQLTLDDRSRQRDPNLVVAVLDSALNESVELGPALAPAASGLYLAWTGTDRRLNFWRTGVGTEGRQILSDRSRVAPALASTERAVVLAWIGEDHDLHLRRGRDGILTEQWTLGKAGWGGPAVALQDDRMVLAWKRRGRLHLMRWTGRGTPERWRLPATSLLADPALCLAGDDIVLAWAGTNARINLAAVRDGRLVGRVVTDIWTWGGPAIAVHNDHLYLAWSDSDRVKMARCRMQLPAP
jgi:hypothetical protein